MNWDAVKLRLGAAAKARGVSEMTQKRIYRKRRRMDARGAGVLAGAIAAVLMAIPLALGAQNKPKAVRQSKSDATADAVAPDFVALDKKFKGNLPITQLTPDEAIVHALNRLGYGPRPGDVQRIRQMGLDKWVEEQLHPETINDGAFEQRLENYPTLKMAPRRLLDQFPPAQQAAKKEGITKEEYQARMQQKREDAAAQAGMVPTGNENFDRANQQLAKVQGPQLIMTELSMAKLDRAIYSERQLEAVMEDFWFNHFNIYWNKDADKWMVTSYVRDAIRPHVMGKFEDLLIATAKSPAMLIYLDNWLSADPVAFQVQQRLIAMRQMRYQRAFGAPPPNGGQGKNKDRGLNENYGREVMELHTLGVDGGYTQQDVIAMAELLTGWTVREPRRDPEFFFDERLHVMHKEAVMGHTFGGEGIKDGEDALRMLAKHPSTARFISTKLARHFVADNPPPALVERMTKTYLATGGDIRAVLKTMIDSPEFWSKEAVRAKVKTPFELVASTARALHADVEVTLPLVNWVGRMGEPLYQCQPPTGYSDKAETWVNTGALLNRLNFAMQFASDRMGGALVNLHEMFGPEAATDPRAALARALEVFLDGQVAAGTRQTLEARLDDPQVLQARLDDPVKQVNEGLLAGLVLGAPEFQRR
jgi:uncharacterized protein (DUF1800 family)